MFEVSAEDEIGADGKVVDRLVREHAPWAEAARIELTKLPHLHQDQLPLPLARR